jgi:uncharacterized membrane protein
MPIDRVQLKALAREDLRAARPNALVFTLVYLLVSTVLTGLSLRLTGQMEFLRTGDVNILLQVTPVARVLDLAIAVISSTLGLGFTMYCLQVSRGIPSSMGTLLDGFGYFLKYLGLNLVMGIFIFLWTLLFVIPGIVAAYRYSLAVYLMLDEPELGILDCIRESKRLMDGHKGERFVLDLSFLGWSLLCVLPVVGWVLALWVNPYIGVTGARYYQALRAGEQGAWGGPGGGPGGAWRPVNSEPQSGPWRPEGGAASRQQPGQTRTPPSRDDAPPWYSPGDGQPPADHRDRSPEGDTWSRDREKDPWE